MQGIVNRAIQNFVRDTYGNGIWARLVRTAGLPISSFEPMLDYDPLLTERILVAASAEINRPIPSLLEDLGTYLVTHQNTQTVRRLLRFGGRTFEEFVLSLDELPERAKLALPEFELPDLGVELTDRRSYQICVGNGLPGFAEVLTGLLRAMADDYGCLAFVEDIGGTGDRTLRVTIAEDSFAAGREFTLTPVQYAAV